MLWHQNLHVNKSIDVVSFVLSTKWRRVIWLFESNNMFAYSQNSMLLTACDDVSQITSNTMTYIGRSWITGSHGLTCLIYILPLLAINLRLPVIVPKTSYSDAFSSSVKWNASSYLSTIVAYAAMICRWLCRNDETWHVAVRDHWHVAHTCKHEPRHIHPNTRNTHKRTHKNKHTHTHTHTHMYGYTHIRT